MTQLLSSPNPGLRIGRLLLILFAVLLAFLTLFALLRAALFYSLYLWLVAHILEYGFDLWASRAIALLALGIAFLFPWHILVLPWVGGIKQKAALFLVVTFVALAGMEFVTRDVYFSRADGRPVRFFAKTSAGFRLSAMPGIDPVFGVQYQPVTPDVVREILAWQKRGGGPIPNPQGFVGPFFDMVSGEPSAWFARVPTGQIEIFSLPGFHPRYGMRLEPVTASIVAEYQKQKADAESKTAARRASEEARRLRQPLRPGRYRFTNSPVATIDGLRFTLTEIDLAGSKLIMQLGVENVGLDSSSDLFSWERKTQRYTRMGLIAGDGEAFRYTAIRVKEGALSETDQSMSFPLVGKRGAFVLEFVAPKILHGPFSFVVNEQPVFSGINLRKATFESF